MQVTEIRTMSSNRMPVIKSLLLLGPLAGLLALAVLAQSAQQQEKPAAPATSPSLPSRSAGMPSIAHTVPSGRQALMLRRTWGVDDLHVRSTASGEMIRFSYRVVDSGKAWIVNDEKVDPYMVVLKTGTKLQIPETEKVGKLRQTAKPENGREYWMVFTNVGRLVKAGDRVDIVIGTFRATQLIVESSGPLARVQNP